MKFLQQSNSLLCLFVCLFVCLTALFRLNNEKGENMYERQNEKMETDKYYFHKGSHQDS
jgi:hypothetical protein